MILNKPHYYSYSVIYPNTVSLHVKDLKHARSTIKSIKISLPENILAVAGFFFFKGLKLLFHSAQLGCKSVHRPIVLCVSVQRSSHFNVHFYISHELLAELRNTCSSNWERAWNQHAHLHISNTPHTYLYALSSAISLGAHPLGKLLLGHWVGFCNNLE